MNKDIQKRVQRVAKVLQKLADFDENVEAKDQIESKELEEVVGKYLKLRNSLDDLRTSMDAAQNLPADIVHAYHDMYDMAGILGKNLARLYKMVNKV